MSMSHFAHNIFFLDYATSVISHRSNPPIDVNEDFFRKAEMLAREAILATILNIYLPEKTGTFIVEHSVIKYQGKPTNKNLSLHGFYPG